MVQLVYLSSTPALLTQDDIAQILLKSRENNAKRQISGLLLYKDGNVLQVLEGEREAVHALFEKVKKDRRHRGIIRLYEKEITRRDFPDWTMGYYDLNAPEARELDGYSEIMESGFDLSTLEGTAVAKLLKVFKAGLR